MAGAAHYTHIYEMIPHADKFKTDYVRLDIERGIATAVEVQTKIHGANYPVTVVSTRRLNDSHAQHIALMYFTDKEFRERMLSDNPEDQKYVDGVVQRVIYEMNLKTRRAKRTGKTTRRETVKT